MTLKQKKSLCLCDSLIAARENVANSCLNFAEFVCSELGISTEPLRRICRKKKMPGDGACLLMLAYLTRIN